MSNNHSDTTRADSWQQRALAAEAKLAAVQALLARWEANQGGAWPNTTNLACRDRARELKEALARR